MGKKKKDRFGVIVAVTVVLGGMFLLARYAYRSEENPPEPYLPTFSEFYKHGYLYDSSNHWFYKQRHVSIHPDRAWFDYNDVISFTWPRYLEDEQPFQTPVTAMVKKWDEDRREYISDERTQLYDTYWLEAIIDRKSRVQSALGKYEGDFGERHSAQGVVDDRPFENVFPNAKYVLE